MEINPQIKVTPIVGNLFSEVGFGIYRSVDVVIGCLDSRLARYLLNRLCMRAGKTWIDGSIENLTGAVKVYTPGINCYECGLSREEFNIIMLRTGCADVVRTQTSAGRVATTPISASIIGAMQVQEAMKIIHLDSDENHQFKTLQGKMLRYEGMTNSMNIYRFASWKRNCPAHEKWENIIEAKEMSASLTIRETMKKLKKILDAKALEINMRNNKFIDKIVSDRPEKEFEVMVPESKLDDCINSNPEMKQLSYRTLFHKSFYEVIDRHFPYLDMTLQQIGIPPFDILEVVTDKGLYHVELTSDSELFI